MLLSTGTLHRRPHTSTHAFFGEGLIVTALFFAGEVAGALLVDHCFFFIFLLFLNCHLSVHFTLFMQVHKLKKKKIQKTTWRQNFGCSVCHFRFTHTAWTTASGLCSARQNDYFYYYFLSGFIFRLLVIPSMQCIVYCDPKRGSKSVDTPIKTHKWFRKFVECVQVSHCNHKYIGPFWGERTYHVPSDIG